MLVTHNHNYPLSQVAKFQFDHRLQKKRCGFKIQSAKSVANLAVGTQ